MNQSLYLEKGWINAGLLIDCKEPFVIALGGRGIGKSYGVLSELYNREIPFIYMRRTQTQLDAVTVQQLNPFNQIATDQNVDIVATKMSKHTTGFYKGVRNEKDEVTPSGEPFAVGVALSTFSNIRSISAERFQVLFFDEIIPERHERPIKEEGLAFANVLESLNRNREIQERPPLKVILASNSNTINSQILEVLGVLDIIDSMNRNNINYKSVNGLISIYRYTDSPISERKKQSALYNVVQNSDFYNMSINNEFGAGDYENVQNKPLNEYKPVCSYGGITVYKHKSRNEYYIIKGVFSRERYDKLPLSTKAFNRKYYYLFGAMMEKRIYYQSASVKIEFEGAFK